MLLYVYFSEHTKNIFVCMLLSYYMGNILKLNTIRGRITSLVVIIVILLTIFSSVTYYLSKKLDKLIDIYAIWGTTQVNVIVDTFTFAVNQAVYLENIVYNRILTKDQRSKRKSDRINSIKVSFEANFSILGLDSNIIHDEKTVVSQFEDRVDLIYQRMEMIRDSNLNIHPAQDSIVQGILKEDIQKGIGEYYNVESKMLSVTSDGRNSITDLISKTIKSLITIILTLSLVSTVCIFIIWHFITKSVKMSIQKPKDLLEELATGKMPPSLDPSNDELGTIIEASNKLSSNLKDASQFALEIGQGNFEHQYTPLSQDDLLGNALLNMRTNLKQYAEKDKQQNWINIGLAKFADILRNNDRDVKDVASELISTLIRYINANQGGLFLHDDQSNSLKLLACYAYERKKFIEKEVFPGEGLVGQCFLEGDKMLLTEIPENYIKITSGIGEATPTCLLLVPLKIDDKTEGVLEIAAFHVFKDFEIEFVEKLSQSIASVIVTIKRTTLTKKLLEETGLKTIEMRNQEEEMRQNLEELNATQEEMRRRENSYLEEINSLKSRLEKYEAV